MKQTTHTDKAGIKKESLWTTLTCGLHAWTTCVDYVRGLRAWTTCVDYVRGLRAWTKRVDYVRGFRARLPGVVTGHGHGP